MSWAVIIEALGEGLQLWLWVAGDGHRANVDWGVGGSEAAEKSGRQGLCPVRVRCP